MTALEWSQYFSHNKSKGTFPDAQWQLTHMLPNLKPIQDVMIVLITCKNEEEPIKNEETRVVTRFSPL